MQNLTRDQLFLAAVAAAPAMACALYRLALPEESSLCTTAARYGFSYGEACGIMCGWDTAAGKVYAPTIRKVGGHEEGFESGFRLGQTAWAVRVEATNV